MKKKIFAILFIMVLLFSSVNLNAYITAYDDEGLPPVIVTPNNYYYPAEYI